MNKSGEQRNYSGLEIAVIGMAGRFPGARDIGEFRENLENGIESVSFFTDEELSEAGIDGSLLGRSNYVKAARILEGKEYFDSSFFGYLPDEARLMDPQVRLFHECAWEALESAGYDPRAYPGLIGLYAGAGENFNWEIYSHLTRTGTAIDNFTAVQLRGITFLATRVSYKLNLKGPAVFVQSACSTSLTAIHTACRSLLTGDCQIALAGGVSVNTSGKSGYFYREGMIASPDGHCRAFDADAGGTSTGEGAAVVVLKKLKSAVSDGDHIWAVIKGTAANNDGERKVGYTAPSIDGQAETLRMALKMSRVEPHTISYIETHGTGTKLGDPVEIEALTLAYGDFQGKKCALGAVKTNIGHLDAAAGGAGFIKTVLALKHRKIPPTLHYKQPNPKIDFENTPFYVNTRLTEWTGGGSPLRAGVSSFGIGGTNVHVILEEAPEPAPPSPGRGYHLFLFSAKNLAALERMTANLTHYLKAGGLDENRENKEKTGISPADAAFTLQVGRRIFRHRRMAVGSTLGEIYDALTGPESGKLKSFSAAEENREPSVIFMFPGTGSQYAGMGRGLYENEPFFRQEMDRCFEILDSLSSYRIKPILYPGSPHTAAVPGDLTVDHPEISQLVIFTVEYALAKLLIHWGIAPRAMTGYSFGEYTAACISGVISLEDALKLIIARGNAFRRMPEGAMLSVPLPMEEVVPLLTSHAEPGLYPAIDNGPSCVAVGSVETVGSFQARMKEKKIICMPVPVSRALHSPMMAPISMELETFARSITLNPPQIPYVSNVTGTWITDRQAADPYYWAGHMQQTVRFADGVRTLAAASPDALYVEVGPGRDLCALVARTVEDNTGQRVFNLIRHRQKDVPDHHFLLDRIGTLWLHGVTPDWKLFYEGQHRNRVPLPAYPFEKIEYPVNVNLSRIFSAISGGLSPADLESVARDSRRAGEPVEHGEDSTGNTGVKAERPGLTTAYEAPATALEEALAALWQNFFGIDRIGIDDDFFELGGDSLKAMSVSGMIHREFDAEIPLTVFFDIPTIRQLAERIDAVKGRTYEPVPSAEKKEYYPVSPAQKRMYILQQMELNGTGYNQYMPLRLNSAPDRERLRDTFLHLVRRHESLRTSFHMVNREPVQVVHDNVEFDIECLDVTAKPPEEKRRITGSFIRPFDLSRAPLLRVGLIKTGETEGSHILMVDLHHIAADGTSQVILMEEVKTLEAGRLLPPLSVQYRDFAEWRRGERQQAVLRSREAYWLEEFPGDIPVLNLPVDFPRPAVQCFEGRSSGFTFSSKNTRRLNALAVVQDSTLYILSAALLNVLLTKLSGQEDIILGTAVAGRSHPDLRGIVGMFINTLAIRCRPQGEFTFTTFLKNVKEKVLTGFENQDYPFEELVEKTNVVKDAGRNPVFDVMFTLQNIAEFQGPQRDGYKDDAGDEERVRLGDEKTAAKFDLTIEAVEIGDRLRFDMEYAARLFKPETVERFFVYFKNITARVLENPEVKLCDIDFLPSEEKQRLLHEFNDTETAYPREKTIHELFEMQACRTPDAVGVIGDDRINKNFTTCRSYKELNREADQMAALLRSKGVTPGAIVGLMAGRSIEMIVSILGILKAGGVYLPIDTGYPEERIRYMLADSGTKLLLSDRNEWSELGETCEVIGLKEASGYLPEQSARYIEATEPCYIIYTSGSTGKPKGVLTMHYNVTRVVKETNYITFTGKDRVLQLSNYAFDGSVFDIYGALLNGAALVMVSGEEAADISRLAALIEKECVSVFFVTTALFNLLVDQESRIFNTIRSVLFGGERVSVEHTRRALAIAGPGKILHVYGPTEATVYATYYPVDAVPAHIGTIPIGIPLANTQVFILDKYLNPVPMGVTGEMYIGGDGTARGYLNRPELTAERFCRSNRSCGVYRTCTLYRTGDLARYLPDGSIVFEGRTDHQVKIRGFRIELGEIESHLRMQNDINEAVVLAREDKPGERYLCAYIVTGREPDYPALKSDLAAALPGYMIPSYFVRLNQMPLNPNGKVDTKALPVPVYEGGGSDTAPPRDEIEKTLACIWADVLGIDTDTIGRNADFFALGGHSLRATVLVSNIHKAFDIRVPLGEVFRGPTLKSLAEFIRAAGKENYTAVMPVEKREYYKLSPGQKRLYVLQQMEPGNITYNIPLFIPMTKTADPGHLENTFKKIIARHESLRTSFLSVDNVPVQRVHHEVEFKIERCDEGEIANFIRPFDLKRAPLFRAGLVSLEENRSLLMVDVHHIVSDGTSQGILSEEFQSLYAGNELPPLKLQYKDYAEWKSDPKQLEAVRMQEAYWKEEFRGEIPVLSLPLDFPRPPVQSFEGNTIDFSFTAGETRRLTELASGEGATLYMVLASVFDILLSKLSGQEDIVVGVVTAGRGHADLQRLIGMFVNTLALRNFPSGNRSFRDFLAEVKERTLRAFENQEYPFEELVEKVQAARDVGRNPLFDVMFLLQNLVDLKNTGMGKEGESPFKRGYEDRTAKFDITLMGFEAGDRLMFSLQYCTRLFKGETARRFSTYFKNITARILENPAVKLCDIDFLPAEEKQRLLHEFNDTETAYPRDKTIHELFEMQAFRIPDAVGVIGGDGINRNFTVNRTYKELNREADQMAALLRSKGIGPGAVVGLLAGRSIEMIVSIMGILKAGGAYLPIDSSYPEERIRYMLADSKAALLLKSEIRNPKFETKSNDQNSNDRNTSGMPLVLNFEHLNLEKGSPRRGLVSDLDSSNLAYVIYTSGSTGKPKGVLTTHYNVTRVVRDTNYIEITGSDRILQLSNYAFDGSVFDIYGALLNGAALVMVSGEETADVSRLAVLIEKECVSVFFATTALFNLLVDQEPRVFNTIRKVLFGGERVSLEHAQRALTYAGPDKIIHVYGPTEATVFATDYPVDAVPAHLGTIPIGVPLANTQVYILDKYRNPVPTGVTGEMYIGGDGNARGYLNRPELTAERFVRFSGFDSSYWTSPLYRTGDLAYCLHDGNIVFQGRTDHQVKIRGFRIELGEIENRLLEHPDVKEIVALALEKEDGDKYLCAYIVPQAAAAPDTSELAEYLSLSLPGYMIPAYFVQIDKIPLNPNGKVDLKSLPVPLLKAETAYTAPMDDVEEKLVEIWSGVLGLEKETLGVTANFFALGGHSLKATIIMSSIHKTFNVEIPLAQLFRYPTIRELSGIIKKAGKDIFVDIEPVEKREYYEPTYNQERLWLIYKKDPLNTAFNMPDIFSLNYDFDIDLVKKTLMELAKRHESLRLGFIEKEEKPFLVIKDIVNPGDVPLKQIDISHLDGEEMERQRKIIWEEEKNTPFDLFRPPLFRVVLVKWAEEGWDFIFNIHHIVNDGWSQEIIKEDFLALYSAFRSGPGPQRESGEIPRLQYKDFAAWQSRRVREPFIKEKAHRYWRKKLEEGIPLVKWPAADGMDPGDRKGAAYRHMIDAGLKDRLKQLALRYNTTLTPVLLSCFTALFSDFARQEAMACALIDSGRYHVSLSRMTGFFINPLVFSTKVRRSEAFGAFLHRIDQEVLELFQHRIYPHEPVLDELNLEKRDPSLAFNLINIDRKSTKRDIEPFEPFHIPDWQEVKFDMEVYVTEHDTGIILNWAYRKSLFTPDTAAAIAAEYGNLADYFAQHPDRSLDDFHPSPFGNETASGK